MTVSELTKTLSSLPHEAQIAKLIEVILTLDEANKQAQKEIIWLQEQVHLNKYSRYKKTTDSTQSLQIDLFFDGVDGTINAEEAEDEENDDDSIIVPEHKRKVSRKRKIDTSKLPREIVTHDLSDAEKICDCGCTKELAGEDVTEEIDIIPTSVKVIEHHCPKYTCRKCNTINAAKKPEKAIPKCMATDNSIAGVIVRKYEEHMPLYRQSQALAKHGADIPDNTLGNWVMRGAEALEPLCKAFQEQITKVSVLQADETPLKVLKPDKKGYMWAFHSCSPDNRFILFEFHLSRAAEIPNNRLKDFSGCLQTDGYSGYNGLRARKDIINFGCWDHARRKVTDAIKVCGNNKSGSAGRLLKCINKLYKVERKTKAMTFAERQAYRQEHAAPLLEKIKECFTSISALPKSKLGVALTYLSNQWSELCEYINHGEVQMSNCWVENQVRPLAVGRRNWLFAGNEVSANKAALLYSLIQTCQFNKINAHRYLTYVLGQVHRMRRGEVDPTSLLPQFVDRSLL